jgi:four helix bundle protein
MNKFIPLHDLEVYQLARELSRFAWKIFERLVWEDKKIMGFQFVESADSIGANIAEGYGRFHYLDRIKFYYNSRGSYNEFRIHWLELLMERNKISQEEFNEVVLICDKFQLKLNNFISSTYRSKSNEK